MPKNGELTEKDKLFCQHYVASEHGTASYINAFNIAYDSARAGASRLLANDLIQAYIQELKDINDANRAIMVDKLRDKNIKSIESNLESASRLRKICNSCMDDFENPSKKMAILTDSWLNAIARAYEAASRLEGKAHERMIMVSGLEMAANEILAKEK
ncbi:MAG: terminase small subunit [Crocosphaera sp.]|nr:terminase small subunit [Crocosphaera sp.]